MTEDEFDEMTEDEFERLEKLRAENNPWFYETVQRFVDHPAVHLGFRSQTLLRIVYPVIFSGKSDKEIWEDLDKLLPPGKIYF